MFASAEGKQAGNSGAVFAGTEGQHADSSGTMFAGTRGQQAGSSGTEGQVHDATSGGGTRGSGPGPGPDHPRLFFELQIRTQAMDDAAESGEAAHTAYKGGLDMSQARQLQVRRV